MFRLLAIHWVHHSFVHFQGSSTAEQFAALVALHILDFVVKVFLMRLELSFLCELLAAVAFEVSNFVVNSSLVITQQCFGSGFCGASFVIAFEQLTEDHVSFDVLADDAFLVEPATTDV